MSDHHPGAGVVIEVRDGVRLELRVHHDDGRADLERPEQRPHEARPGGKREHDTLLGLPDGPGFVGALFGTLKIDRKSTRLNSSHITISYAALCLNKKLTRSL